MFIQKRMGDLQHLADSVAGHGPAPRRLHILLMDGRGVSRSIAIRVLEKQGHNVAVAEDRDEAMVLLEHEAFDLALVDLEYQERVAHSVAGEIQEAALRGGARISVWAMSTTPETAGQAVHVPQEFDRVIAKPLDSKVMELEFRRWFSA